MPFDLPEQMESFRVGRRTEIGTYEPQAADPALIDEAVDLAGQVDLRRYVRVHGEVDDRRGRVANAFWLICSYAF
jgi:hypothetical protein